MGQIIPLLAGGLALFLYAISQLSRTLRNIFSEKAKEWINKSTKNLYLGILTGTLTTALLDSSSAVIIIAIVLINAGTLNFRQTIGIVMGANIGTTFSSQLIALDIAQFSFILLVIGMLTNFLAKNKKWRTIGRVTWYFGMLFFGLYVMETSVEPLKDSESFEEWIMHLENPWKGTLLGGLITLIIQSSSATVGLAITLGKQGLISVKGGLALMMGAELGTCSDTLLATIGGKRQALKTGIFHLIFNLISILIGLLLFEHFYRVVEWVSGSQGIDNHIANGHMIFNIVGVLLFLPLVRPAEKLLNRLLPDKPRGRKKA